ncbi:MAG: glycosyltransferase family 39 protein [Candidatus Zixiibacteriota bacterium]
MKSQSKKEKKQGQRPKEVREKRSGLAEFFKNPFFSSRIFEVLLFCCILGLALLGGVLFLSADPPHISWSQDVATDPPQYTDFARNKALWGSFDLFGHNRFIFFLKSFTTVFSYAVFLLFGTGRFQANLVAVLLNLLTMIFFFLALKKVFSKRTAFLSLFFLGINFVFVMYGRNPFLEISAIFLLVLGFYFLVSSFKTNLFLIPSGVCFAGGIFFGKTMAAFILPACLAVLLFGMFQNFSSSDRKIDYKPLILWGCGFVAVALFWLFFSYLPAKREVAGYLGEQALGLYGFPKAFQSISGFITSLYTFGTDLFYRMPVAFVLSFLGLLSFFLNRSSIKELIGHRDHRSAAKLFLVLWFLIGFFVLMALNYRPLRYQLYLIPPLCALSGLWLDSFLRPSDSKRNSRLGVLFWLVFVVAVSFFVNYVIVTFYTLSRKQMQLTSSLVFSFVITLFSGVLLYLRFARSKGSGGQRTADLGRRTEFRWVVTLVLLLASLVVNVWQYVSWASSPTYSLNKASLDLGAILSKEAVLSGPYGPALAWDNNLRDIIHMFGVTKPDPQLFRTYPITHLALERGGNRDRAFQDYPDIMNKAHIVATYVLRNIQVDVYRIAEWTANSETEKYSLSDFEKAKMLTEKGQADSAVIFFEKFVSEHPDNQSGYQMLAGLYYNSKRLDKSAQSLERAAKFHPTDFLIHQQLGVVYLGLGDQRGDDSYRLKAIDEWEKSLRFFPENSDLVAQLQKLKGY